MRTHVSRGSRPASADAMPKRKNAGDDEGGLVELGVPEEVLVSKGLQVPGGVKTPGEVQALEDNQAQEKVSVAAEVNMLGKVKVSDEVHVPVEVEVHDDVVATEEVKVPTGVKVPEDLEVPLASVVCRELEAPNDCEAIGDVEALADVEVREMFELLPDIEIPEEPPLVLVEMDGVCSRYGELSVDYRRPCTSREGHLCHIAANLKAWNSFFWVVGLELQEDSASQLTLVLASDSAHDERLPTTKEKDQAVTLLYHLLTIHRCVVGVTINDDIVISHEHIVCHAIRESLGVRRLWLAFTSSKELASDALGAALVSLTQLKSLTLIVHNDGYLLTDLVPLLAETGSLTTLTAVDVSVCHTAASTFLDALFRNRSITYLSLTTRILNSGGPAYGPSDLRIALGAYLKLSPSLRSVLITAPKYGPEIDVWTICDALATNKVLLRLELKVSTLKLKYAKAIKRLLHSNKTLRYLNFTTSYADSDDGDDSENEGPAGLRPRECPRCRIVHLDEVDHVKPWISALLENETSITKLRFSMWGFSVLECQEFCRAVNRNKSLKKIILKDLGSKTLEICSTLVECGLQDRVIVDSRCVVYYPDTGTRPINCPPNAVPFRMLQTAADRVTTSRNLTRVTLQVYSIVCFTGGAAEPALTPIVQLIRRATCIKDLVLRVETWCCSRCCNSWWGLCGHAICDAVCQNQSIRSLTVIFRQSRFNMAPLASLLSRSQTLRKFTLEPVGRESFTAFIAELSKQGLEHNYTLQYLTYFYFGGEKIKERLAIQDIMLRNRTLSNRATRFATGTRLKYTAEAFEKVSNCPGFIAALQSAACVHEVQAKEMIARCVLQLADFSEFMRLAGVVRACVECIPTDDGETQLSDLPELCLSRIRHFLRLSDVISSPE